MRTLRACGFAVALLASGGCGEKLAPISGEFRENFSRSELGSAWRDTGGAYRIVNGELTARRARYHPLWLRRQLPTDLSLEFDVRTSGSNGDIRVVLFGNGKSTTPDAQGCQSTGYQLVFGGWNNQLSVLCRADQRDQGHQRARADWPVLSNRSYHFYVTRKEGVVAWYIDGHEMMSWRDPEPLQGPGHEALGLVGGESEVFFDNLVIGPYHP